MAADRTAEIEELAECIGPVEDDEEMASDAAELDRLLEAELAEWGRL
jgi:hypothetical protein